MPATRRIRRTAVASGEAPNAAQFVRALRLTGKHFGTVSLSGLVEDVHRTAAEVWQHPQAHRFVDHGLKHSMTNVALVGDLTRCLPTNLGLSPLERALLGCAALLHDIGMQYNKYVSDKKQLRREEIRAQHVTLGYDMFRATLENARRGRLPVPQLRGGNDVQHLLEKAAVVGFAHSGDVFWKRLESPTYASGLEGGQELLRPRLLAAMLRAADEMDCAFPRIVDFALFGADVLDSETEAHWSACFYVQEVHVSAQAGLRVTVRWRLRQDASQAEKKAVHKLLKDFRVRRIAEELGRVQKWLIPEEGREPPLFDVGLDDEPVDADVPALPQSVRRYVSRGRKRVRSPQGSGARSVVQVRGSGEVGPLREEALAFLMMRRGAIAEHHVALRTGWHTNRYVQCRELLAQAPFVDRLCMVLADEYRLDGITDVLAIGTTGIRLGIKLAVLLECAFHYTFDDIAVSPREGYFGSYSDYDREVVLPEQCRVLIVDDIVGMGSVLGRIAETLKGVLPRVGAQAFCLYALGNLLGVEERLGGLSVKYLAHYGDIEYYEEESGSGKCRVCRDDEVVTRREM